MLLKFELHKNEDTEVKTNFKKKTQRVKKKKKRSPVLESKCF